MWREPMVIIGGVVVVTLFVCGLIAVILGEGAIAQVTILLAFSVGAIAQIKAMWDAKEAKAELKANTAATQTAVVVAEQTREEQVKGREQVQAAVQQLTEKVATKDDLVSVEQSGVAKGMQLAGGTNRERNNA